MAIINTIRHKFGWFVSFFILIILVLFVLSSGLDNINKIFGSGDRVVGKIAGESVSIEEFQKEVDIAKQNYEAQSQHSASDQEMASIREQAWNQLIQKIAFKKQYDKLGMKVTGEELYDMVQGNNIDPVIKQSFSNPQTGQFDKNFVIRYLKALDTLPAQAQAQWTTFEAALPEKRLKDKYDNLISLSAYVTKAEAEREYQAQASKAEVKFLYVPFYSIPDSTLKVDDAQLKEYYNKHKNKYKSKETRTIEYVSFPILPAKQDSAILWEEIKKLARGLAITKDDSLYAKANSDVPFNYSYQYNYQLPQFLQDTLKRMFIKGSIIGPYREGGLYSIYKLADKIEDSIPAIKASHILIKFADSTQASKTAAYNKAKEILATLKGGKISFEDAARQNSQDPGSGQNGGDLNWFTKNGQMVKPFETAAFGAGKVGLIDKIVETQFGYHIIKVTQPPTRTKYRIAGIQKNVVPSDATREEIFKRADKLAGESETVDGLKASVKKDLKLNILKAEKVDANASFVNTLRDARPIVFWAFNEGKIGSVAKQVFEVDNQFVVAGVSGKTEKDEDGMDHYKTEITAEVKKDLKANQILAKLNGKTGTLESIAQVYGASAQVNTVNDVALNNPSLGVVGFDPGAVGKAFSLKPGQKTKAFIGENGVLMLELINKVDAPVIADYSQYKNQLKQMQANRIKYAVGEAIREASKIEDKRYKFY